MAILACAQAAWCRGACLQPCQSVRLIRSARRNHRKYVGADGIRAIVGGLCIGDEWSGDETRKRMPWRDTAVEVRGPAVSMIDQTFHPVWEAARGEGTSAPVAPPSESRGSATVRVVNGVPGSTRTFRTIQLLAASAAERLWITDAYLLAPQSLVAALSAAARDGVDVRLLVPGRTDLPPVRAFTRVGYRELLEAGVRIWEWQGPMLHAKTVVVDHYFFKVGSSNLNASSFQNNYELDVLIEDASITATAVAQFRVDLRYATEVVLRAPGWVPGALAQRLPPAVIRSTPTARVPGHRPSRGERSQQAVVALRQVAGGARRSIAGAIVFSSLGAAALVVALPRVTAYILALGCFWLALRAAWEFRQRRRGHGEAT